MTERTVTQTSAPLSLDERRELEALHVELGEARRQQAALTIENARLFEAEQAVTKELQKSLAYQTATSNVLGVISRSPSDLTPVFDIIVETARRLCTAEFALIFMRKSDGRYHIETMYPANPTYFTHLQTDPVRPGRQGAASRAVQERRTIHIADVTADPEWTQPRWFEVSGARTYLSVPLLRNDDPIGVIAMFRQQPNPFNSRQIDLITTFANQAVIAIENARLLKALQTRQSELAQSLEYQTATAKVLSVISASPNELRPALEAILEAGGQLCGADRIIIHLLVGESYVLAASRGVPDERRIELQQMRIVPSGDNTIGRSILERGIHTWRNSVPDTSPLSTPNRAPVGVSVPLIHHNRVAGVLTLSRSVDEPFDDREIALARVFADQAVIAINSVGLFEQEQTRSKELSQSLADLRAAQDRLVQTEKLASLGQLTAGIAHEIKNPLNFINNFADLSVELVGEFEAAIGTPGNALDQQLKTKVDEITGLLKANLAKVVHHGRRADSIVKNMLAHSRQSSGERRRVDLNAAVEEALNLSYHGARAENPDFKITLERDYDASAGPIGLYPQEFTRVLLNLIGNGFHAANKKRLDGEPPGFEPILRVSTKAFSDRFEISIRDNGTGIPDEVKPRIFEPFFTTKPTGEGTGLGLSLAHDIVVKQHGGMLTVTTKPGVFTEFAVILPRNCTPLETRK